MELTLTVSCGWHAKARRARIMEGMLARDWFNLVQG